MIPGPLPDASPSSTLPPHHDPRGGFRNPGVSLDARFRALLRWRLDRRRARTPRDPEMPQPPGATPSFPSPRAAGHERIVTWVGHSTFLVQLGDRNLLTDPMWSHTASPFRTLGPRRWVAPGIPFDALPPIDAVLLSHNHYDHLDDPTVRRLAAMHPEAAWVVPLGLARFVSARGVQQVIELDWWDESTVAGVRVACTPAQHASARTPFDQMRTLWCSYLVRTASHSLFFAGDSGYNAAFSAIGKRYGAVDLALMPIGSYEPRWFMQPVHLNPEEAVQAYRNLQGDASATGTMVGMHWGTFLLADEPFDEPPHRARAAWAQASLPPDKLWILKHGETRRERE